ncbi:MAG: hypothetical protein U0K95_05955 [Eubacterium sp.]|nr:hypothetical protein [Eubacterium sp.]
MVFLLKNKQYEFTPVEVSKQIGVTSKTVINRCAKLAANGFVTPNLVKERITNNKITENGKNK